MARPARTATAVLLLRKIATISMFPRLPMGDRTLIMRSLKGLESFISVSVVHPLMLENGWTFGKDFPDATGDTLYDHQFYISSISMPIRTTRAA